VPPNIQRSQSLGTEICLTKSIPRKTGSGTIRGRSVPSGISVTFVRRDRSPTLNHLDIYREEPNTPCEVRLKRVVAGQQPRLSLERETSFDAPSTKRPVQFIYRLA
jgi:hypothetical protein